jgi:hypothetical protein
MVGEIERVERRCDGRVQRWGSGGLSIRHSRTLVNAGTVGHTSHVSRPPAGTIHPTLTDTHTEGAGGPGGALNTHQKFTS